MVHQADPATASFWGSLDASHAPTELCGQPSSGRTRFAEKFPRLTGPPTHTFLMAGHEVATREAIVRADREAALTRRDWAGVDDGAPIGTGVPRADWLESRAASPDEARAAANVALLRLADGSLATGFHMRLRPARGGARSCLVTAAHALPTAAAARRAVATFTADAAAPVACDPGALFFVDRATDVAVVALRADLGHLPPLRCCARGTLAPDDLVHLVQHPNGNPVVALHGRVAMASSSTQYFLHTADTLAGSSGAPVFDARWRLVGVHVGTTEVLVSKRAVPFNEACHIQPALHELRRRGYAAAPRSPKRRSQRRSRRRSR